MKLIIGLGNPGAEYALSRHNAGFLCLSKWSELHKTKFKTDKLFDYIKLQKVCLIKPNTFMNRSGQALAEAVRRWNPQDFLVVHDDLELPLAKLRLRNGGGDGGHNGVKSLLEFIPGDSLKRIRIGIGRDEGDPSDFVLDSFSAGELAVLGPAFKQVAAYLDIYANSDFNGVLDSFSKWNKSCSGNTNSGNISPKETSNGKEL